MLYVGGRGNLRSSFSQLALVMLGILTISCGKLPDYAVLGTQNAFVADAELNPNVDLLFVIDNSGSMARDQSVLADSFHDFITNFTSKNLQYHIGIITTDTCPLDPDTTCQSSGQWWNTSKTRYPGIFNHGMGSLLTKYNLSGDLLKYLTWDMDPDAATAQALTETRFANNSNLGINGSGSEAGLTVSMTALSSGMLTGYNDGFLREGSFLSLIIVTDEDESYGWQGSPGIPSGGGSQDYVSGNTSDQSTRISNFMNTLTGLKGATLDNFSMTMIAVPASASSCVIDGVPEAPGNFAPALTYNKVVDMISDPANFPQLGNGQPKATLTDICSNFASALDQVGSTIVEANARYKLEQTPADPTQIHVIVNGSVITRATTDGWQYDAVDNAIQFYGTAVPAIGDHISIDYTPGAPI